MGELTVTGRENNNEYTGEGSVSFTGSRGLTRLSLWPPECLAPLTVASSKYCIQPLTLA